MRDYIDMVLIFAEGDKRFQDKVIKHFALTYWFLFV